LTGSYWPLAPVVGQALAPEGLRSRLDHPEPRGFNTPGEIMAQPFQRFSPSRRLSESALPLPTSMGTRGIRKNPAGCGRRLKKAKNRAGRTVPAGACV